jgi:hypothetical protein
MIKLSILIPAYNFKKGLKKILSDFAKCNKSDLELIEIIIGDDSENRILDLEEINKYNQIFPNFKYIKNEEKLLIGNWNNLINKCQGEYYWLFHHDEELSCTKQSIKIIIEYLKKNYLILILPLFKKTTFRFLKYEFKKVVKHTGTNKLIQYFICQSKLFIYINIIGPPTALIISKKIKSLYSYNFKWLVDVEYYYRIFKKINLDKILLIKDSEAFILSNQDYNASITKTKKLDKKHFNKLKFFETKKLKENINLKHINKIKIFIIWTFYKIYSFFNSRIYKT